MRNEYNSKGLLELAELFPQDTVMAEIGCYAGESMELFFKSGKIKQFFAIDPWEGGYNKATSPEVSDFSLIEHRFDERAIGKNIVKLKMTIGEAFDLLPELDVVYIDGNHDYNNVFKDITLSLQKVKRRAIICGHDYGHAFSEVNKVIEDLLDGPDMIFSDTSWMVRIK